MVQFRLIALVWILFTGLLINASAQDNLHVRKISFSGNDSIRKETLLKQMNTKPRVLAEKLKFWEKGSGFNTFTFQEDIARLKKYYQKNGFLEPEISYDLVPDKKNRKLHILILINQGRAVTIDQVDFSLMADSASIQIIDSLRKIIPLHPSSRFRDENITVSEKMIHDRFTSLGYPFISIEREITLEQQTYTADILFTIRPGNKSFFGKTRIMGDSLISRSLISKHIEIERGDVFSQPSLDEIQEEIFDLGLFRYVTIRALTDSVKNDTVPIAIQLRELPRWSLKTGIGYGTEDRVRISLLLNRLNFLGGGRTLIIKGQHSYFVPINIETKFIQPDLLRKNLDFILNPYFSREREESYVVDRLGTSGTLQQDFTKRTSAFLSYSYGKDNVDVKILDPSIAVENGENLNRTKSGITLGFNRSTTDQLFSPTKGWKIGGLATYMGIGFNSQYHYYKVMTEVVFFRALMEHLVFAAKMKGAILQPVQGDLSTPIEDRFLIGGAGSLRGWGRNQISPVNLAGDKLGGNSMLEGSAELRFPLYRILSGVLFTDFGNIWLDSWDFKNRKLKYDLGLGLRVKTPVGPIRFDVATPIFDGKFNAQFFVTIGHAF